MGERSIFVFLCSVQVFTVYVLFDYTGLCGAVTYYLVLLFVHKMLYLTSSQVLPSCVCPESLWARYFINYLGELCHIDNFGAT